MLKLYTSRTMNRQALSGQKNNVMNKNKPNVAFDGNGSDPSKPSVDLITSMVRNIEIIREKQGVLTREQIAIETDLDKLHKSMHDLHHRESGLFGLLKGIIKCIKPQDMHVKPEENKLFFDFYQKLQNEPATPGSFVEGSNPPGQYLGQGADDEQMPDVLSSFNSADLEPFFA